jgi:hypothetical protein
MVSAVKNRGNMFPLKLCYLPNYTAKVGFEVLTAVVMKNSNLLGYNAV